MAPCRPMKLMTGAGCQVLSPLQNWAVVPGAIEGSLPFRALVKSSWFDMLPRMFPQAAGAVLLPDPRNKIHHPGEVAGAFPIFAVWSEM